MNKKNQIRYFWICFLIFILSLFYSLPRFSNAIRIKEEKNIVHTLEGSDPYHVQWHNNQIAAMKSQVVVARIVFFIGLGFLCFGLYFTKGKR